MKTSVRLKWNGTANVCTHCGKETETLFVVTGHDHTDSTINLCICGKGISIEKEWNKNPYARETCPQEYKDLNV